jgi:hypothetical protein
MIDISSADKSVRLAINVDAAVVCQDMLDAIREGLLLRGNTAATPVCNDHANNN